MNEADLMENRYEIHLAMKEAEGLLPKLFAMFGELSGRHYGKVESYGCEDAKTALVLLGSSYDTALEAMEELREKGEK